MIGETLERATPEHDFAKAQVRAQIVEAVATAAPPPDAYSEFCSTRSPPGLSPRLACRPSLGRVASFAKTPRQLEGEESAVGASPVLTGIDRKQCEQVLRSFLMKGSTLRRSESSRFPIFAFRLHQFLTRGDTVWTTLEPRAERHLEMSKQVAKPGGTRQADVPAGVLPPVRDCAYFHVSIVSGSSGRKSC